MLELRAFIAFGLTTLIRIVQISFKSGSWFGEQKRCDGDKVKENCIGDYNERIMDPIKTPASYCLYGLVFLSAILVILCFKRRSLAKYFMTLEFTIRLVSVCIPKVGGDGYDETAYLILFAFTFCAYYVGSGPSLIYSTFVYTFSLFFGVAIAYNRPLD